MLSRIPLVDAAAGLLALAAPAVATAQVPGWSPWGGPDSPGGLFGGDPAETEGEQNPVVPRTPDRLWGWVGTRLGLRGSPPPPDDARGVTAADLGTAPGDARRDAWFRAADRNGDGRLSMQELRDHADLVFRFHDSSRDGQLDSAEIRRQAPSGTAPAPGAPPPAGTTR